MHMLRSLNLSADQQSQIRGIAASYKQKNQGLTDRAQLRANHKQMRDDIMAVLTPQQQQQLKTQMQQARRAREQNGAGAPPPPVAPAPAST
jgi:Spy/CpxP family protein refolding chaperone